MEFDLTYEYAEKVLKGMEDATPAQIARALEKTLKRKLGLIDAPAPSFDAADKRVGAEPRFERFFDELFTVAPANIDTPLSDAELRDRAQEAYDALMERAKADDADPDDDEGGESARRDAFDYATMVDMIERGDVGKAIAHYRSLDTYARNWLYLGEDDVRNRRTALALGEI